MKPKRHYDNFGMTQTEAFKIMVERKLITPKEKSLIVKTLGSQPQEWCEYHQAHGHPTDNYYTIKNKLQSLIDEGTLPKPNVVKKHVAQA